MVPWFVSIPLLLRTLAWQQAAARGDLLLHPCSSGGVNREQLAKVWKRRLDLLNAAAPLPASGSHSQWVPGGADGQSEQMGTTKGITVNADFPCVGCKKCWQSFEEFVFSGAQMTDCVPFCLLNGIQSVVLSISSNSFGKLIFPVQPPTSMLGKGKYETVSCYPICQFIRSLGREPHFFSICCHAAYICNAVKSLSLQWPSSLPVPAERCPALSSALLYFSSEEEYTFLYSSILGNGYTVYKKAKNSCKKQCKTRWILEIALEMQKTCQVNKIARLQWDK